MSQTAVLFRHEAASAPASADPGTRTLEVVFTTSTPDREGDVVEPLGLDFSAYLKNPVVLWAHDQSRPPVGRVRSVAVSETEVSAVVEFAAGALAEELFSLYAEGFLNAWSIGFLPGESVPSDTGGVRILAAEVVEISAVPVPSNPEALTKGMKRVRHLDLRRALLAGAPEQDTEEDEDAEEESATRPETSDEPGDTSAEPTAKEADEDECKTEVEPEAEEETEESRLLSLDQLLELAARAMEHAVEAAVEREVARACGRLGACA